MRRGEIRLFGPGLDPVDEPIGWEAFQLSGLARQDRGSGVDLAAEADSHSWILAYVVEPLTPLGRIDIQLAILYDVVELNGVRVGGSGLELDEPVIGERPVPNRRFDDLSPHSTPWKDQERPAASYDE